MLTIKSRVIGPNPDPLVARCNREGEIALTFTFVDGGLLRVGEYFQEDNTPAEVAEKLRGLADQMEETREME